MGVDNIRNVDMPPKTTARLGGFLFLVLAVCSGADWGHFNSIFVPGDALATATNIRASEGMYRLYFAVNLLGQVAFLFSAYFFYKLFKPVNRDLARLMALLVFVSVPIAILNMLNQFAPILLLNGGYQAIFGPAQLNSLILLFLELYKYGMLIAGVFWGLWLFPLGFLVYKSGFIPRFIGVFLVIAGIGYIADSSLRFLMPGYKFGIASYTFWGELMLILWLLIRGVRKPAVKRVE
jgi:hypothetical protein